MCCVPYLGVLTVHGLCMCMGLLERIDASVGWLVGGPSVSEAPV